MIEIKWYQWIGIGFVVISLLIVLVSLVYFLRRKHSKQRFAFFATTMIFAFATTLIGMIVVRVDPYTLVILKIVERMGLNIEHVAEPLTLMELGFLMSIFMVFVFVIREIYVNWSDDNINPATIPKDFVSIANMIKSDAAHEFKVLIGKSALENTNESSLNDPLQPPETLVWHQVVRELMCLKSKSYEIDDEDWHDLEHLWIGRNRQTGHYLAVLCCREQPAHVTLEHFVEYVISQISSEVEFHAVFQADTSHEQRVTVGSKTIFICSEAFLLDNLVDFHDYFREIARLVHEPMLNSTKSLVDVYVSSPWIHDQHENQNGDDVEAYILEWIKEPGQRQLALLGQYGMGKTSLSRMLSYHLIQRNELNRIPIIVTLRGRSPRNMTVEGILAEWAQPFNINANALMRLHQAGRILLILEGFDEIDLVGSSTLRHDHFRVLWGFTFPKAKVLFTGRPNFFLDDQERKKALGIDRSIADGSFCEAIRLKSFSTDHVIKTLLPSDVGDEIIKTIENNPSFANVVTRPSLLQMTEHIWRTEKLADKDNLTSARVMSLFIKQTYARQIDKVRFGGRPYMQLRQGERAFFMRSIACYMSINELPNTINKNTLKSLVLKFIPIMPDIPEKIREPKLPPFKNRIEEYDDPLDSILTDIHTCGLLVDDVSRSSSFQFAHKSYMEFLCAETVSLTLTTVDNEGSDLISAKLRFNILNLSYEKYHYFIDLVEQEMTFESDDHFTRFLCGSRLRYEYLKFINVLSKLRGSGILYGIPILAVAMAVHCSVFCNKVSSLALLLSFVSFVVWVSLRFSRSWRRTINELLTVRKRIDHFL